MQATGQFLDRLGLAHDLAHQTPTSFRQDRKHTLRVFKRQRHFVVESLRLIGFAGRVLRALENPSTVSVRMTILLMSDSQATYLVQFSTTKPFTRSKSFTLFVTTMAPIARACAAIMRSAAPIWAPRFFRSARISA